MKGFFKTKKISWYLMIPALILSVVALVLYQNSLDTRFGSVSQAAVITFIIGIVLCVLSLILDYREIKYLAAAVLLYACLDSISSQANYITNVMVSIDGNSFSAGFLSGSVCSFIAWVIALIASRMTKNRLVEKLAGIGKKEAGHESDQ